MPNESPAAPHADEPAWWQEGGDEHCGFCLQVYAYEMEVRCGLCDRGVCPCCVRVTGGRIVLCPDCEH